MARPDLSDREALDAYNRELRRVAWPLRVCGLILVVAATSLLVAVRTRGDSVVHSTMGQAGLALMAVGWAVLFFVIARRTAYHRRRMAEEP